LKIEDLHTFESMFEWSKYKIQSLESFYQLWSFIHQVGKFIEAGMIF